MYFLVFPGKNKKLSTLVVTAGEKIEAKENEEIELFEEKKLNTSYEVFLNMFLILII